MTSLSQNQSPDSNDLVLAVETYVQGGETKTRTVFKTCTGLEAYANIIADAVRTLRGEIQLNTGIGIPYLDTIWESPSRLQSWKMFVRKRIEDMPFVVSIEDFDVELHAMNHTLTYSLRVATDRGELSVGQTLEG